MINSSIENHPENRAYGVFSGYISRPYDGGATARTAYAASAFGALRRFF